ncbi:MAG TPA: acyl-CoA reductase [Thermoanaerobaculia bacterium]|jgi:acyl-CoA reductase-like NAD-dependent aldehyde dehydrogenase
MLRDWAVAGNDPPALDAVAGGRPCRAARWDAERLAAVTARLAARGAEALAAVPLERRLAAWIAAVEALLDPESDERRELFPALLSTARLSPEGLTEALDIVVGGAGADAAAALAARRPAAGEAGVDGVVLAANVPGLAVQSVLPALVAGRPLVVRSPAREPLFAPALVAALVRREPALAEAFAAVSFAHGRSDLLAAALGGCRRVLAYGGRPALAALGATLGERLVAQGPKASVAFVAGERDALAAGRAIARDVALLDQRGCLSVQAIYVAGEARELADALVFALALEHRRLPPGPAEPELVARLQQWRREAALAGALVGELDAAAGTVVADPELGFRPTPGLRSVRVHSVDALDDALAALAPWRGALQGAALAGEEALARGEEIAARLGLARCAPAGRLQHAEAGWASGGIDPLGVFA